jgi:hypothetical protein
VPRPEAAKAQVFACEVAHGSRRFARQSGAPIRLIEPVTQIAPTIGDFVDVRTADDSLILDHREAKGGAIGPFPRGRGEPGGHRFVRRRIVRHARHPTDLPVRLNLHKSFGVGDRDGPQHQAMRVDHVTIRRRRHVDCSTPYESELFTRA